MPATGGWTQTQSLKRPVDAVHAFGSGRAGGDAEGAPLAEAGLEVLDGAQAAHAAGGHDGQACAQRLALLHAMGGQDDCLACRQQMAPEPLCHWSAAAASLHVSEPSIAELCYK